MATFKELLVEELSEEFSKIAPIIEEYARSNHRFTSNTGVLEQNTESEWNETEQRIETYVPSHVEYAEYVINGQGTWAPDNYIDDAIQANQSLVDEALDAASDNAWDRYANQEPGEV